MGGPGAGSKGRVVAARRSHDACHGAMDLPQQHRLRAMAMMTRGLGYRVIAEAIENACSSGQAPGLALRRGPRRRRSG